MKNGRCKTIIRHIPKTGRQCLFINYPLERDGSDDICENLHDAHADKFKVITNIKINALFQSNKSKKVVMNFHSLTTFLRNMGLKAYSAAFSSTAGASATGASTAAGAASAFLAAVERRVRAAFLVAFSFNMFSL